MPAWGTHVAPILTTSQRFHDDVIKWNFFPRYWPLVRGIHRSPVNSPHKGKWRGALLFSLIYAWINDWVNNGEAGDLRRYPTHYDVTVMFPNSTSIYKMPAWYLLLMIYIRRSYGGTLFLGYRIRALTVCVSLFLLFSCWTKLIQPALENGQNIHIYYKEYRVRGIWKYKALKST